MAAESHKCIVGLLHHVDYSDLVTLEELQEHIEDVITDNILLDSDPVLRGCKNLKRRVWTLAQYADWRTRTNLKKFNYCPMCGSFIDWREIRWRELRRGEDG